MALVQKISPIGVDKIIDSLQDYLYSDLNINDWESYPRAYKNPAKFNDDQFVAEVFANDEYYEVFFNDDFSLVTFFVVDDQREFDAGFYTVGISLIIQANIKEIYPSITHRADEELLNAFVNSIQYYSGEGVDLGDIETSVESVYREFDFEKLKFNDMNDLFVARINMTATYYTDCCSNC
jgi:hypothetical protein